MDYILYVFAFIGVWNCLAWLRRAAHAGYGGRRLARRQHDAIADITPDIVITKTTTPLSWASKEVLREYKSLPAESQTYGDIEDTLRALDTKHGWVKLNSHLRDYDNDLGYSEAYSWTPTKWNPAEDLCKHYGCIASEHYALHRAIESIILAIAEKEKSIALAGLQHELGQVPSLLESLKIEAEAHRP